MSDRQQFQTGAVRAKNVAGSKNNDKPVRYDLISPIGLRRLAETSGAGAALYGDYNWRKGMPATQTINHVMAHINEYLKGDKSEDHLSHAAWGLFVVMHMEETKPEMIDIKTDDYATQVDYYRLAELLNIPPNSLMWPETLLRMAKNEGLEIPYVQN